MPAATGVSTPPPIQFAPGSHEEIQALVAQGKKIDAIKRVREMTGLGLKEAKDYVEQLSHALPLAQHNPDRSLSILSTDVEQEARQLMVQRGKIHAIKRVREVTGMGLKEAKDYVESL
jgi:ribosomal protein L7/L12